MDEEVSIRIENTCLSNLQELRQKRIQSLTSISQVIPENNDYGDEEVQCHFEGKVMPDDSVPGADWAVCIGFIRRSYARKRTGHFIRNCR